MIAIVGAMDVEIELLKTRLTDVKKETIAFQDFYLGKLDSVDVVITKLGIAKVNAAATMTILLSNYKIDYVINTGIAGGLSPLNRNDIVLSNKVYHADVDARGFGYSYGTVPGEKAYFETSENLLNKFNSYLCETVKVSNVATMDQFVTSFEQVEEILKVDDSIKCVDMESAAVAQIASKFNVDFIIIRSISDIINDKDQMENYKEEESAKIIQEFVVKAIKN